MTDPDGNQYEVKEVLMSAEDLDAIVTDPEQMKTLLLQILQNLTVLNYVVAQMAELLTVDLEAAKTAATNDHTGMYL